MKQFTYKATAGLVAAAVFVTSVMPMHVNAAGTSEVQTAPTVYSSVSPDDGTEVTGLGAGVYQVPVTSLESAAPLPAVKAAFQTAFGDSVMVKVDSEGNKTATVNCQHMIISLNGDYHANILTVENEGAKVLSTKKETYSTTYGTPDATEEIEVPDQVEIPLTDSDNDGAYEITLTVDFMNAFLGKGESYPTNVTLTLDETNAVKYYEFGYGNAQVNLAPATYTVPVKMMRYNTDMSSDNYFDDSNKSMAGSCVSEPASIMVHEDGTATMTLKLSSVSFAGATDWALNWSIYQDFDAIADRTMAATDVTRVAARIDETTKDGSGVEQASTISFTIPDTDRNGVYNHMYICAMGKWEDAIFALDWKNAAKSSDATSATSQVEGDVVGGSHLAAIGAKTYEDINTALSELTEGQTLRLNKDAALTANAEVAGGNIELDGHVLTQDNYTLTFAGNSVVTDNSIEETGKIDGKTIKVKKELTLDGITVIASTGIQGSGAGTVITLKDSTLEGSITASNAEDAGTITIENSKITGNVDQSSDNKVGTMVMKSATINGIVAHGGNSLNIKSSKLTGRLSLNGTGTAVLEGSNKFTGNNNSVIEKAYSGDDYQVIIKNGTYEGGNYAIQSEGAPIQIEGGYFKGTKGAVFGGYTADGSRLNLLTDGNYAGYYTAQPVSEENAWDYAVEFFNADGTPAGGVEEDGIIAALCMMKDGQYAVLKKDVEIPVDLAIYSDKNVNLDLNGHVITTKASPIVLVYDGTTVIQDSSPENTGWLKTSKDSQTAVGTAMKLNESDEPHLILKNVNCSGFALSTFISGKVTVRGGYMDVKIPGWFINATTLEIGTTTWAAEAESGDEAKQYGKLSDKINTVRYSLEEDGDTVKVVPNDLGAAIEQAENVTETDYTKASWEAGSEAFKTAYDAALAISGAASEEDVETAVNTLNTAMEKLVKAASKETFEELNQEISKAKEITQGIYTTDSYKELQAAIAAAEQVVADRASQADTQAALSGLKAAVNGLKEVTAAAPANVKASAASYDKATVTWSKAAGAAGYEVYQYDSKTNVYTRVATANAAAVSSTISGLKTGTSYTFAVRAYSNVNGQTVYSAYVKAAAITPALSQTTSVKAAAAAYNKVKVSWKKVDGANGYEVYQYNSKTKKYTKAATVKNGASTSYTVSGLATGTAYKFKVRAYRTVDGKNVYGSDSKVVSAKPVLNKVTGVKAKNSAKKTAKITWKKVAGASGYTVYRSTKKNGKYTAVKTIKKAKTVSFTNKKLKKDKTYYYKVKAYRTVNGKKVYSGFSTVVSVKIKK